MATSGSINGQKVWNTSAHHADLGMLLARTNWDVPKHAGISYFALPMRQPGVDVRPLRQMNGYASFNEVFLTDVRVPADNVIGDVDGGWRVALATLAHERRLGSVFARRPSQTSTGRAVAEATAEAEDAFKPYVWYPQRAGRADLVAGLTKTTARGQDPVIRQEVARLLSLVQVAQWTAAGPARHAPSAGRPGRKARSASSTAARSPVPPRTSTRSWPDRKRCSAGQTVRSTVSSRRSSVSVPAASIAGGTDEIQHNILGERVLGLPKEPQTDRDMPFRSIPKNPLRTGNGRQ